MIKTTTKKKNNNNKSRHNELINESAFFSRVVRPTVG